jgi:hypothetical protein
MTSKQVSDSQGGIGVLGLLGVVFVTLKLCGVIDWSWWWVTVPFWGGFAFFLAILAFVGLVWVCAFSYEQIIAKRD